MATPIANAATPVTNTASPATPVAAPAATTPVENKNKYTILTGEYANVQGMLKTLTNQTLTKEAIEAVTNSLAAAFKMEYKDTLIKSELNMKHASALFGKDEPLKENRIPENEKMCKEQHEKLTTILKKKISNIPLTREDDAHLQFAKIEFCKLMKSRGINVTDCSWFITNSEIEAGVDDVDQKQNFDYCCIIYSALDAFDQDVVKTTSYTGMIQRFKSLGLDPDDMRYAINSVMIFSTLSNNDIETKIFGDAGITDAVTKNTIARMCVTPGNLKLFAEIDVEPLTPLYRIVDPASNPNIGSSVNPAHYYFIVKDRAIILDIDPATQIISKIMVNLVTNAA
jgi:hypothetical protein